jgi:hypothetical protein
VARHGKQSNTETDSICRNAESVAGRFRQSACRKRQTGGTEAVVGRLMGRQIGRLGHWHVVVDVGRESLARMQRYIQGGKQMHSR